MSEKGSENRADPMVPILLSGDIACTVHNKKDLPKQKQIQAEPDNPLIDYINLLSKIKTRPSTDALPILW